MNKSNNQKSIWKQKLKPKHFLYGLLIGGVIGGVWALIESYFSSEIKFVLGLLVILIMVGILIIGCIKQIQYYKIKCKTEKCRTSPINIFLFITVTTYLFLIPCLRIIMSSIYPAIAIITMIVIYKKYNHLTKTEKIWLWLIFIVSVIGSIVLTIYWM